MDIQGTFEAKGIKNAKERLQFVAAEVREPWPEAVKAANVDTLMMKHFLSGFSDEEAKIILKHISAIQQPKSHILLFQVRTGQLHGSCMLPASSTTKPLGRSGRVFIDQANS